MLHHDTCPVCAGIAIHPLLSVTDFSVSGETFAVWACRSCGLRFTQDAPDETLISRYYKSENYISHTNAATGIVNKAYLAVREFTLGVKYRVIKKYTAKSTGTLLDVGAGTGAFVHYMARKSWTVTGLEPDAGARAVARKTVGLELLPAEAFATLPQQHFDAITLWHVLEHMHRLQEYMGILKSFLKPGGVLFIAVPNHQSTDAKIYGTAWAAYDVPRHLYHFSPQAMKALVQRHGLKIVAQKPMWFDAFYISLLSSKYKHGVTNWAGAISSGLRSNLAALRHNNQCSSLIYVITA